VPRHYDVRDELRQVWENPRELLFVAIGSLLGLGWGVSTLVSGTSVTHRALGLVAAVAGFLVLGVLRPALPVTIRGNVSVDRCLSPVVG
jgi:hypothetical protein